MSDNQDDFVKSTHSVTESSNIDDSDGMMRNFKIIFANNKLIDENLAKLTARIERNKEQTKSQLVAIDLTTKVMNEKLETIPDMNQNIIQVDHRLTQLDDIADNVKATAIKVEEISEVIPSMIELRTHGQQIALLNNQVTSSNNLIKKQALDSDTNCQLIISTIDVMRESIITYFDNVNDTQNQSCANGDNYQYTQSTPHANFRQNLTQQREGVPSNLFNESVQHARGGLQHTPALTVDQLNQPGVQTRKQKMQSNVENANKNDLNNVFDSRNHNGPVRQPHDEYKEAMKTRRHLCQNAQHLEKFDSVKYSFGYFIRSRIMNIAKRNQLKRVQDVTPWLPNCFPNCQEAIEREINHISRLVYDDDDLLFFLTCLARRCNRPYGRGVHEDHIVRKENESILDYINRMYIEYDTVVDSEEEITILKTESKITKDIYNQLRYRDNEKVRQAVNFCAQGLTGPINSRDHLELLANKVDNTIPDGPGSSVIISAIQRNSGYDNRARRYDQSPKSLTGEKTQISQKPDHQGHDDTQRRYDQKIYPTPQTSSEEKTKVCASCKKVFLPLNESHEMCVNCFTFHRKMIRDQGTQQRSQYPQQSRGRYNNNRRRIAIVEATGETTFEEECEIPHGESEEEEIRLMSEMPNGPINGSEFMEDSHLLDDESAMISMLQGYGYPKTRDRVFIEFSHTESDAKGRALIDCGANTDAISSLFLQKANISNIDKRPTVVRDFQGKPCKSLGKVEACLRIGKVFYKSVFTIFDGDYKTDVILGMPFLNNYGLGDILRESVLNITGPNTVLSGEPKNSIVAV